ncbi:hypothetical protein AB0O67_22450 [Streptomyces sp. NPDC086077]|uniref:hypothetical protein n=1 Tax=Streptomyces sp. NPDC086077 TaxID=3154862 RepID=UPI0034362F0B
MSSAAQPRSRRPAGRGVLLLMLVVLAGSPAMHGLAPGNATAAGSRTPVTHAD